MMILYEILHAMIYRLHQWQTKYKRNKMRFTNIQKILHQQRNHNPEILSWRLCSSHCDLLGCKLGIIPKHAIFEHGVTNIWRSEHSIRLHLKCLIQLLEGDDRGREIIWIIKNRKYPYLLIDLTEFARVRAITLDADVKVRHKIFTSV